MDSSARLTSKGQVTIPKRVRDALELNEGDEIVFRVERKRAIVAKTPDFLGDGRVGRRARGEARNAMDEVLARTRRARSEKRR